ncbi:GAF domain-containing protein [Streptomyces sp. NPDC054797]
MRPAAATEARTTLTELLQAQVRQGPCVEAHLTGAPVHADALADHAQRWPAFVEVARAAGYESAHAFPLRARQQSVGALNLLSGRPVTLGEAEIKLLRPLADVATTAVPHEAVRYLHAYAARRGRQPTEIAEQLVRRRVQPDAVLADAAQKR